MKTRTISKFRVKNTLKRIGSFGAHDVLARFSGVVTSFFIVDKNWESELFNDDRVTLLAHINRSNSSNNVQVEFVDPSLTFQPEQFIKLASMQTPISCS